MGIIKRSKMKEKLTYCFDIDGVIANLSPDNQYDLATPNNDTIEMIKQLYEKGHQIILFTARGSATGIDWQGATRNQMDRWGVKYHELLFGKPAADFYIDDKLISLETIKEMIESEN